ncbi:MAG: sporulation protein YunB [Anaerovoracaceae bacterium]
MGRKWGKSRKRSKLLIWIIFILTFILFTASLIALKTTVESNLEEIAKVRAKILISRLVNSAINDQFSKEMDMSKLVVMEENKEDEVKIVHADTKAMNLLVTEISKELQKHYVKLEKDESKVPLGAILGSKIFSQTGPKVTMTVIPQSVSNMDFKTEFEAKGINQTKYKIYIILESQVQMLAPFAENTFSFSSTILIAEAVILGKVPNSYVQVPKEDILDVTKE